jgi:hypothetical protein
LGFFSKNIKKEVIKVIDSFFLFLDEIWWEKKLILC